MRANRYPKFLRHKQHAQDFGDSRKSARVNLAYIDGLYLQKLLKYHPVVGMLARGYSNAMWC